MVGGHPQELARAERELGLASWSAVYRETRFRYPADEVLWRDGTSRLTWERNRLRLLRRAFRDYDVIHYNFGQTLFPSRRFPGTGKTMSWRERLRDWLIRPLEMRDLRWLKEAGKIIAVTFQGNDARQGNVLADQVSWRLADELPPDYYTDASDAHKRWRIAEFDRWADAIYALNPDLLRVLPARAKFLPYANVDPRRWAVPDWRDRDVPLVMHAPSHRGIKGTRHVLAAVEQLKRDNIPFQFELIEGLTNEQAIARYCEADLLIDQLLLGWYGGLAVELMALGRPVVGNVAAADLAFVPPAMRAEVPIIRAGPDTLYGVLRDWLTRPRHELRHRGARSRAYVERWHDPLNIAVMTERDYRQALTGAIAENQTRPRLAA
jgi:hypothetical protein